MTILTPPGVGIDTTLGGNFVPLFKVATWVTKIFEVKVFMQPELMREIVTVEAFDRWLIAFTIFGFVTSVAGGLIWAKRLTHPKRWQFGGLTGLLVGCIFPLIYALWRLYLWRIRIDLDRDFVGLHRTDVLIGNFLIFALAGTVVGLVGRIYARWLNRQLSQGE